MRLTASLGWFWYFRGHYSEGRALRAAVLALPIRPELAALRSEVLQGGGMLALLQGDYAAARAILEASVSLARGVQDQFLLASTLSWLGFVTRVACDYATARSVLEEALAGARTAGDAFSTAMALHHLGLLALEAEREAQTCWALNEESLALLQAVGDRRMIGVTLQAMGRAARAMGDRARARALIAEALALHTQVGDSGHVPQMLYHLAAIAAEGGQLERAVRVAASASKMSEEMGTRVWPVIQRERDAWLEPARGTLGYARFALAWESGQAMTREQAARAALAEDHPD
jgi:non-specific serine/threonine protein kinase